MRVDIDYTNRNQNVDNGSNTISHGSANISRNDDKSAFVVDITGSVMATNAYGGQGKTTEEIMQEAGQIDVSQQKNYMTVMSNSMSEEDFAKLQKEGYHPADTEIGTMVTVVDRIKAELVEAGVQVTGYTDTLDTETLRKLTGNEMQAQQIAKHLRDHDVPVTEDNVREVKKALDKVAEITVPSEGAVKYMVQNHMEPTIDNIYTAEYSSIVDSNRQGRGYYADEIQGYYAKKADDIEYEQLLPQLEKTIKNAGIEINENSIADAKWLIEKGIPFTVDTLQELQSVKQIQISNDTEKVADQIAKAIGEGKTAGAAYMVDMPGLYEQAVVFENNVNAISDQAINQVVSQGISISVKTLSEAQKSIQADSYSEVSKNETLENSKEDRCITVKRQMAEIRLQMSTEANIKLLRKGIHIDTTELETLINAYKKMEEQQNVEWFGESGNLKEQVSLYKETIGTVDAIASLPAAVLGKAIQSGETFTLQYVYKEGRVLQSTYQAAGQTYEALMTAPRADLGDSIKKAFRNVDDLLDDINLDHTDMNRRAVRILGYNRMNITQENVVAVKSADEELKRVVQKMTPAATLKMIRDGMNPLEADMTEMEAYISKLDQNTFNETEKYSKYLYKLEQNHKINAEEKKAYIGIYRLIRQVEKTDGAAIGTLLNQGKELSFQNLLTAVRSNKKAGINLTIDDSVGGIDSVKQEDFSISDQINTINTIAEDKETNYQKNLLKNIFDQLDPTILNQMEIDLSTCTIEQLSQQMEQFKDAEDQLEKNYQSMQLQEIQKANQIEESVIQSLLDLDQPVTVNNLMAMHALQNNRGNAFGKLWNDATDTEKEDINQAIHEIQNSFDISDNRSDEGESIKDHVQNTYQELKNIANDMLQARMENPEMGSLDIKSMALTFKQITLAADMAKEEQYEVPVQIGDNLTSLHIRFIRGSEHSKVSVTTKTDTYGEIAAEISVSKNNISGYIATNSQEGYQELQGMENTLKSAIENALQGTDQKKDTKIQLLYHNNLNIKKYTEQAKTQEQSTNDEKVSSKELYSIAKCFIMALQN